MTEQGEEVRVEPNQLRGKADELQDVAVDVSARPTSPCALTFVQSATAQIVAAANTLQSYVASGNAEATRLSEVLNEAAGVYDKVDEARAQTVGGDRPAVARRAGPGESGAVASGACHRHPALYGADGRR